MTGISHERLRTKGLQWPSPPPLLPQGCTPIGAFLTPDEAPGLPLVTHED